MMGLWRLLLHPSHINPTKSNAAIVTIVSTLILLYSESSKGSDMLYLLGTTNAGHIALKKLFQCGFSTILNGEALAEIAQANTSYIYLDIQLPGYKKELCINE